MAEMYSNANNCHQLACILYSKLGDQIRFSGDTRQESVIGYYFSKYRYPYGKPILGKPILSASEGLPFYFKYCEDGFLRFEVGSFSSDDKSTGEKLAALSDFYAVLRSYFGEASVFYTIKDDEEECLSLQWVFKDQKSEIQKFQDGSYFDDGEIDQLILIGQTDGETIKSSVASKMGLPFELLRLVDENMEDFVKFKMREKREISNGSNVEPVTSFQKVYQANKKRN